MGEEVLVEGASPLAQTFCHLHWTALYGSTLLRLVREVDPVPNALRLLLACFSERKLGLLFFFDLRWGRVQIVDTDRNLAVSSLNGEAFKEGRVRRKDAISSWQLTIETISGQTFQA